MCEHKRVAFHFKYHLQPVISSRFVVKGHDAPFAFALFSACCRLCCGLSSSTFHTSLEGSKSRQKSRLNITLPPALEPVGS